jgi:D-glycero-D-manno-heptose 1,7-bisphosphate phosphatase
MLKKALFLDRDGVINIDHGYLYKIEDFEFTEGIFELLKLFSSQGYLLFVVTNQSGIGRKYYTQNDFKILTQWMLETFLEKGIVIEGVQFCPHTPGENCRCRKPATGMVDNILKHYPIDLQNSWLIGDKQSDIDLAVNLHIENRIAVGDRSIEHSTYSFETVSACNAFLHKHKDIIQ